MRILRKLRKTFDVRYLWEAAVGDFNAHTHKHTMRGKWLWKLCGGICPVGRLTELPLLKMRVQSVQWIALGMTVDWRHQGEARQNESESSLFKIYSFFMRKAHSYNLGVVHIDSNFPPTATRSIALISCWLRAYCKCSHFHTHF